MLILLVIEVFTTAILYLLSRNNYKEDIYFLDEKDALRSFMPMGLKLLDIFNHKCNTGYGRKLESKLRDLNGGKNLYEHLRLHMAGKIVLMLFGMMFTTFIGTQIQADPSYFIFCLVLLGALFYVPDKQLDDKIKNRKRDMQLEFPEFLNKLILLVNAGLTVQGAINKITRDNRKSSKLYVELTITVNEINAGKSEIQAFEDFARRCGLQEVTMFVAALLQNLRKGSDQLIPILRLQANTCWDNRKNVAKKLGEEASTRLIFPMMIIFVAILVMIMAPAVMQIQL